MPDTYFAEDKGLCSVYKQGDNVNTSEYSGCGGEAKEFCHVVPKGKDSRPPNTAALGTSEKTAVLENGGKGRAVWAMGRAGGGGRLYQFTLVVHSIIVFLHTIKIKCLSPP